MELVPQPSPTGSGRRLEPCGKIQGSRGYGKAWVRPCKCPLLPTQIAVKPSKCDSSPVSNRTMSIPSAAIYMIGYENLLVRISPFFTGSSDPSANISAINRSSTSDSSNSLTAAPLVAGSLARTFSATVISPIEMFRTRLQALPSGESLWAVGHPSLLPPPSYVCIDWQRDG